jgi:N-acetylmuramoyl-L-alanine amidase
MNARLCSLPVLLSLLAAACAPTLPQPPAAPLPEEPIPPPEAGFPPVPDFGLPEIPEVEGDLQIRVVHPTPQTVRPSVASTFIYGSVGSGTATLEINGQTVEVHPNGAFLAFLRIPADGVWNLAARRGDEVVRESIAYRSPPTPTAATAPATVSYTTPRVARVTGGGDTLATGSGIAIGRPTPTGTYRWFLPRGATVAATGERGDQVRLRLGQETAWVSRADLEVRDAAPPARPVTGASLRGADGALDVVVPGGFLPFLVETRDREINLTVYGAPLRPGAAVDGSDPMLISARWSMPDTASARLQIVLGSEPWGYRAFYTPEGDLVLRIRRPPVIDRAAPLRGIRIAIDPGHPPAGATGPTGLTEAEANLAIALPLAEMLRERGAEVVLTRESHVEVSLAERVRIADAADAHLLVSVHNNAFPEGVDPYRRQGTSTYYFHPHSARFARALQREILVTTRIPDLGALSGNLALVRPTWMPSVLTESLFMAIPQQEAALRHPGFSRNLAAAHVRGIEAFLRER